MHGAVPRPIFSENTGERKTKCFVTAMADGEIMAVEHKKYPVYGLQFHPESILTPKGIDILRNVVESIRK